MIPVVPSLSRTACRQGWDNISVQLFKNITGARSISIVGNSIDRVCRFRCRRADGWDDDAAVALLVGS